MGVVLDNAYTHKLLACAYSVHTALGPGLLESVYEAALVYELKSQGFEVKHQVPVKVTYKEVELDMDLNPMISGCFIKTFYNLDGEALIKSLEDYLANNEL